MKENDYPKYISPSERDYTSYNEHVASFNRSILSRVSRRLSECFGDSGDKITITTTGSDARLEKGPASLIEIIVFGDDHSNFNRAIKKINECILEEDCLRLFNEDVELKNLLENRLSESVLKKESGDIKFISPNRILDSRVLFSDNHFYDQIIGTFLKEINSDYGKSILKTIRGRVKDHSRMTTSGVQNYKGQLLNHYNLLEGCNFYDPEKGLWSFKQGPLRTVQYSLVRDSIKRMRTGRGRELFFFPKNTIEKLNCLEVEHMTPLSSMQVGDLSDCYKYFLHLYHQSQFNYKYLLQTENHFDIKEVKERCKTISDVCSFQLIK